MPEGPELKYLSTYIEKEIKGKTLKSIETVNHKDNKFSILKPSKVKCVTTIGKNLTINTKDYYVNLHLSMSGWLYFGDTNYPRYRLHFNNTTLTFDDPIKLAKLVINKTYKEQEKFSDKFGVDILTDKFELSYFTEKIQKSKANISSVLMDQSRFAGIGNYIRNEALYIAKILPDRKSDSLTKDEIKKLYKGIRKVSFSRLYENYENNKLKIPKDVKDVAPKDLYIPFEFQVFRRKIDKNGREVKQKTVAGRNSFYVDGYQK